MEKYLSARFGIPGIETLDVACAHGAYAAARKAVTTMKPEQVLEEVKTAGLRGRGGAGFPCGMKWSFVPKDTPKPKYLAVNADEGEPGTFKDRTLMENDPHLCIEGVILASYAVGIRKAFFYLRGEFWKANVRIKNAVRQAYDKGFLGKGIFGSGYDLDVVLHPGAGAYICGEETGLLESLEGKPANPRSKPPFPAVVGAFGCPTVINNIETLANVPPIIDKGAAWYKTQGSEKNPGTRLFSVSGHVKKPGCYELPMGTTIREIIFTHAGGLRDGRTLKAVIPGGSSAPVLRADEIDVKADFDSLSAIKSMGGSAGVIVMDDTTCTVRALARLLRFYAHESCGQCTQCREGTAWIAHVVTRLEEGKATPREIDLVVELANNMAGKTICLLSDSAQMPAVSFITKFKDEFLAHATQGKCPFPEW